MSYSALSIARRMTFRLCLEHCQSDAQDNYNPDGEQYLLILHTLQPPLRLNEYQYNGIHHPVPIIIEGITL